MPKILVFAGTTEGRILTEALASCIKRREECAVEKNETSKGCRPMHGSASPEISSNPDDCSSVEIFGCVATEYGRVMLSDCAGAIRILAGRLDCKEMEELLKKEGFDLVFDTTHPYAAAVTQNIEQACRMTGTEYVRVLRAPAVNGNEKNAVFVKDSRAAAEFLSEQDGNVLLTTGSKELEAFTRVKNYKERIYARVLPMPEVVKKCWDLGFEGSRLICMQGPFSYELNAAMLKQSAARFLVTKDSGKTGGFDEKLQAAEDLGIVPVILGRGPAEAGMALEDALALLKDRFSLEIHPRQSRESDAEEGAASSAGVCKHQKSGKEDKQAKQDAKKEAEPGDWFPLFTNIKGKKILVVGGGKIAKRRIRNLMAFSGDVTVIAREASGQVMDFYGKNMLSLLLKDWEANDLAGFEFVIAATNNREVNHSIYLECKKRGITVNVADCKEECDFYFPGVVRRDCLTIGITAEGKNHSLAKKAREAVGEAIGALDLEEEK